MAAISIRDLCVDFGGAVLAVDHVSLEIESGQGKSAPALARTLLPRARVSLLPDLTGLPRVVKLENIA